ncbi:MAG: EamA family transporter [Firmicutes bacterium]|nr:EamA family transporter [Bacillota bacterium]
MKKNALLSMGPAAILLAAVLWGNVGLFTRSLYSAGFTPVQASLWRAIIAAAILVPVLFITRPASMKLKSWKHIGYFLVSGTFGLGMAYITYFMTIEASTLAMAAVMLYSSPIVVTIMAFFLLKEKITFRKKISLILAFTGCLVMAGVFTGGAGALSLKGLGIGFLSGVTYATYHLTSKMALKHYEPMTVAGYTFLFSVFGMIPFADFGRTLPLLAAHPTAIPAVLGVGVLCTLIPYTIYTLAIRNVEIGKATIISFAEPLTAVVMGLVVFREPLTMNSTLAIAMMLASVVIVNADMRKLRLPAFSHVALARY